MTNTAVSSLDCRAIKQIFPNMISEIKHLPYVQIIIINTIVKYYMVNYTLVYRITILVYSQRSIILDNCVPPQLLFLRAVLMLAVLR